MRTAKLYPSIFAIVNILAAGAAFTLATPCASAQQQGLKQPDASPAASISQTVGLTELKISYHRPAVGGRKIWGDLVPYGTVWRAGANENTTISFSSAVTVGGKTLPAGTYGLQTIPGAKEWLIIFSHTTVAWGSYGYDAKEDALRVTVAANPAEAFEERLSYSFDNPTETAVVATLRWEKLKVPIKIEVDTTAVVKASMLAELRGAAQFSWLGWTQAAQYWLAHGGSVDEALLMVEKSMGIWIVDSHLCAGLGKLATAASIMGVPSVLCGLSADVVVTLESMGFELTEIQTATSLEHALEKLGVFVQKRPAKGAAT